VVKWYPEAIPSLIALFYNRIPARAFRNFYREVANEVTEQIQSGRILDIGTGPGYLPIEIAKLNSSLHIVGIDLSPKMIEIAKENARRKGAKNVTFELADANELAYENDSFDFILSTAALHHWRDRKKIFNNINGVLKKGGTCWIYDLRQDANRDEIRDTLRKPDGKLGYMRWAFKFHGLKTQDYFEQLVPISKEMKSRDFTIEEKNAMMKIAWKKQ
jgi:ubiquinone/menaquinone biosynthesis C-methylase UbiE